MKTMQITGIRRMECIEAPKPEIVEPDGVLLRITAAGVCGSDTHYYETGRIGSQVITYPHRVGHECAGRVEAVGPRVSRLKVGDRVAVDPAISCGMCDQCRAGREHTCRNLRFLGVPGEEPGCYAEYIVMPERCLYPIPKTMTDAAAVICEPFAIGLYAVRRPGLPAGYNAAILGAGPVGLCVLTGCRASGAERVYVTDKLDYRCAIAESHGGDWTGNPDSTDVVSEILRREPKGLQVVFECAGQADTLDQAVELLNPGGTLVLVGIPREDRISLKIHEMRRKDISIINIRRQNQTEGDAVELVASGAAQVDFMATHTLPLEKAADAFEMVTKYKDGVVKTILKP